MPRGRPTRTLRLPADLLDRLDADAAAAGVTVAELVEARCYPPQNPPDGPPVTDTIRRLTPTGWSACHGLAAPADEAAASGARRCTCTKPTLSRAASNICTACGGRRP